MAQAKDGTLLCLYHGVRLLRGIRHVTALVVTVYGEGLKLLVDDVKTVLTMKDDVSLSPILVVWYVGC